MSRVQAASAWAKSISSPGPANDTARTKSSSSLVHSIGFQPLQHVG
jgi:hypothetical protein